MTYYKGSQDKNLVRGDSRVFNLFVKSPASSAQEVDTPIDLTGSIITFTMKSENIDYQLRPNDPVVIRKTSDDTAEVEISDQGDPELIGRATIYLQPDDTKFLPIGIYRYDIQIKTAAGRVYTVSSGRIYLTMDTTAAEDITNP